MTNNSKHQHAEFDRDPEFEEFTSEFDHRMPEWEKEIQAEYHWEGRIAERNCGPCDRFDDAEGILELVAIIGYLGGRYYTAWCGVDAKRWIHQLRHAEDFDSFEAAVERFVR